MSNLNKNIKIFFIDLDGTLLDIKGNHTHDISKTNLKALEKAKEDGKIIVISTGRSGLQAEKYLRKIKYEYAVTGNGSTILKGNKIIKDVKMDIRQTLLITDFAKKHGLVMKLDDSRVGYGAFTAIQQFATKKINFEPVKHFNFEMHKQYHKVVLWGKSKRKMLKLSKELTAIDDLSIVSSGGGWTLEISHKFATKGLGNLYVASKYGIEKKSEMAHLGDSMNDSTVVDHMRLIAMKNSSKRLLKLTKFVGPNYKRGGVAKILNGDYKIIEKK